MRRVADEEHAPRAECRRQDPFQGPARNLVDGYRQVGNAEGQAHVRFDLLVSEFFRAFALVVTWKTHSSLSGPQWFGPMGTSTAISPIAGHQIQRINTSGSRASVDRSAETCAVAVWASTPFVGDANQPGNGAATVAAQARSGPSPCTRRPYHGP